MVPAGSRIRKGFTVSYNMCAATEIGVQAAFGFSGSMVKPVWSMVANTPPERGFVVHWPPHSMIFAACQVGPGGIPLSNELFLEVVGKHGGEPAIGGLGGIGEAFAAGGRRAEAWAVWLRAVELFGEQHRADRVQRLLLGLSPWGVRR
jgi:hypothetical protein